MAVRFTAWRRQGALIALVLASACIAEPELKVRQDIQPPDTGDGWAISTPAAEGFDSASLMTAYDLFYADSAYFNVVSLLVARHGRLVAEAYVRGSEERDRKRHLQSATKSVTSLVFGITRGDGFFPDLDQPLYDILPEAFDDDPRKRAITLHHLLTMRSGIDFDNNDFSDEMIRKRPHNQARYILAKPMYDLAGVRFYYRDADPQLLSSAVEAVTGRTLAAIATERLFTPMGITDYFWEANVDGTSFGPFGLFLRPRDLLKLGQLVLQRGRWGTQQLVPAAWIDLATAVHTTTPYAFASYGCYWWVVPELAAVTAAGHGGQFVFVVPSHQLVLAMTSLPSSDDELVGTMLDRFLPIARKVVAAIRQ